MSIVEDLLARRKPYHFNTDRKLMASYRLRRKKRRGRYHQVDPLVGELRDQTVAAFMAGDYDLYAKLSQQLKEALDTNMPRKDRHPEQLDATYAKKGK
jgi:hypothetical protein